LKLMKKIVTFRPTKRKDNKDPDKLFLRVSELSNRGAPLSRAKSPLKKRVLGVRICPSENEKGISLGVRWVGGTKGRNNSHKKTPDAEKNKKKKGALLTAGHNREC